MSVIISQLHDCPELAKPAVLTIGNFDGVHMGHQAILRRCRQLATDTNAPFIVLTFENHPSEVLRPQHVTKALTTPEYRYHLLANFGADYVVALKFSKEFAQQTPEEFLKSLRGHILFSHLVLGHDARIGKDRLGDREKVLTLAKQWQFHVEYLEPYTFNDHVISSSRIRELLASGNLVLAKEYLGRFPSYYGKPLPGRGLGSKMGFPTLNFDVTVLCLPPFGVYIVQANMAGTPIWGIANLGLAPTVRNDQQVLLEVFLFHNPPPESEHEAFEIALTRFLRPERKFASLDELKQQITHDVAQAKTTLG